MIFHVAHGAIFLLNQGFRVQEKGLAGRGQVHLARTSLQELDSELLLQDLYPQAERGLSQIESRGGTAEMALVGDRHKSPQVPQFHGLTYYTRILAI
jgi:hypothetical protein